MTAAESESLPLPSFVGWPIFPFEGDLRVRAYVPLQPNDRPRSGEPGGGPCESCAAADDAYIWVDERWRVKAPAQIPGVPVQVFLETRDHLDMNDMDVELAAQFGQLIVRLDRAIQAVGGIGRVHVNRWGDGGSHFHMWFYGRPYGAQQMLGVLSGSYVRIAVPPSRASSRATITRFRRQITSSVGGRIIAHIARQNPSICCAP